MNILPLSTKHIQTSTLPSSSSNMLWMFEISCTSWLVFYPIIYAVSTCFNHPSWVVYRNSQPSTVSKKPIWPTNWRNFRTHRDNQCLRRGSNIGHGHGDHLALLGCIPGLVDYTHSCKWNLRTFFNEIIHAWYIYIYGLDVHSKATYTFW